MIAACLTGLAMCDAIDGQAKRAAHRFGAAQVLRDVIGPSVLPVDGTIVDRLVTQIREQLGELSFTQAWEAGRVLPLEHAVIEALGSVRSASHTGDHSPLSASLFPRTSSSHSHS
jgi:hypothetical protein